MHTKCRLHFIAQPYLHNFKTKQKVCGFFVMAIFSLTLDYLIESWSLPPYSTQHYLIKQTNETRPNELTGKRNAKQNNDLNKLTLWTMNLPSFLLAHYWACSKAREAYAEFADNKHVVFWVGQFVFLGRSTCAGQLFFVHNFCLWVDLATCME